MSTSHGPGKDEDFDPRAIPIRPAATVLLVRDASRGMEVFMLRRTLSAVFASGMYVFPGGRVDDVDGTDAMSKCCAGRDDTEASALLRVPKGGLAFWVAAIRECFEEAGVLLATHNATGQVVQFTDPTTASRFADARHCIHDGNLSLIDLCRQEDLTLVTGDIHYVSNWITPLGERRRFDTKFFLARAPEAQEPLHDDKETIDSLWVRPEEALEKCEAGELAMLPPTIGNLHFLLEHGSIDAAMGAAQQVGVPTPVQPRLRYDGDGKVTGVVMPWDQGYDQLEG